MSVNLSPVGGVAAQFFTNSGAVLTGGKIFTYAAGTTTPQTTYTSSSGTITHSNPIILDASGRVPSGEIWLTDGLIYKFLLKDANDVLIGTYDNIIGINDGTNIAIDASNVTYTAAGAGAVTTNVQAKLRETVSVKDFGAVGNGVANDTVAIQAALNAGTGSVFFPEGNYLITSAITVSGNRNGLDVYGNGSTKTRITCSGCSAFSFPNGGYYRAKVHDLFLQGSAAAGVAAFDWRTVGGVTQIVAAAECFNLAIAGFEFGWTMENAQLNYFHDFDIALINDGAVFNVIPINGSGQQCNANRVHRMRATGLGEIIKCTLLSGPERSTDWMFFECDIQLAGSIKPPFHIIDTSWTIEKCEFENATAPNLIHLESTGASLTPNHAVIRDNLLTGGAVPIRVSQAGGAAQLPAYVSIVGNKFGSGTIVDLEAGTNINIIGNEGTVNNTGGRFVTEINNRGTFGIVKALRRVGAPASDISGVIASALSSSSVLGKNMTGTGQFATAGTLAVAFGALTEPDINFRVVVTGNVNETFFVTSKATTGFTINSSNASSTAIVDWFIVR